MTCFIFLSSSSIIQFTPFVGNLESAFTAQCLILAIWTILKLEFINQTLQHLRSPISPARISIYRNARCSESNVNPSPFNYGRIKRTSWTTARHSWFVLFTILFCLVRAVDQSLIGQGLFRPVSSCKRIDPNFFSHESVPNL